jgi:hypothetical protein
MKKFFQSVALATAVSAITLGGTAMGQSNISFGPKAGVALTSITGGDQPKDQDLKFGPTAGGFINLSTDKSVGFSVELLYGQKGFRSKTGGVTFITRSHYVELPVLARFYLIKEGSIRPNIYFGASLNYCVKAVSIAQDVPIFGDVTTTDTKFYNPLEVGVLGGLGLKIKAAEEQWIITDLRYNQGLTPIFKDQNLNGNTFKSKSYNGSLALTLGYAWGI